MGNIQYGAAAIRPDGTVFIATDSWAGVHEFQRSGRWIKNLGGKGHGPGEFQRVRSVAVSTTGRLAIYDRVGRISFFERSGEFSNRFGYDINFTSGSRIMFAGDTRLWAFTSPPGQRTTPGFRSENLVLLSAGGDTLRICSIPDTEQLSTIEHKGTPLITADNLEVGAAKWTVSPDGTAWLLVPSCKQIVRISPETGESDTLAVRLSATVFTRKQWAKVVEHWTAWMYEAEYINAFVRPITRALMQMRKSLSPVQRMWWIDEHGILVDRMPALAGPLSQRGLWRYAALLKDGSMTEEVEGPPGLLTAEYGYALQITSDPGELPSLTLWKLEPAGG